MWKEYGLVFKQALVPADTPRASGQSDILEGS